MKVNKKKLLTELRDYLMISVAMVCYCIGWTVFLLPNNITTGGVPGVSSVIYWGFGIPVPDDLLYHQRHPPRDSVEDLRLALLYKDYLCRAPPHDLDNVCPQSVRWTSSPCRPTVYGQSHRCHLLWLRCRYGLGFQWVYRWYGYHRRHRA